MFNDVAVVPPSATDEFREALRELEEHYRGTVTIEPREEFHIETVKLVNERTGKTLREE